MTTGSGSQVDSLSPPGVQTASIVRVPLISQRSSGSTPVRTSKPTSESFVSPASKRISVPSLLISATSSVSGSRRHPRSSLSLSTFGCHSRLTVTLPTPGAVTLQPSTTSTHSSGAEPSVMSFAWGSSGQKNVGSCPCKPSLLIGISSDPIGCSGIPVPGSQTASTISVPSISQKSSGNTPVRTSKPNSRSFVSPASKRISVPSLLISATSSVSGSRRHPGLSLSLSTFGCHSRLTVTTPVPGGGLMKQPSAFAA